MALAVVGVSRDAQGFWGALATIGAGSALMALVCILLGLVASAESWHAAVDGAEVSMQSKRAYRVFFATQLGKYIPGGVWTVAGQLDAAHRGGHSRSRMAVGAVQFLAIHLLVGLVVAGLLLPVGTSSDVGSYLWLTVLVPLLLVLLHPRVMSRIVDLALRALKRPSPPLNVRWVDVARPLAWSVVSWALIGGGAAAVAAPLASSGPRIDVAAAAAGAFALGWAAGLLVVPAPAGIGPRDVVIFLALAPSLGESGALSLAVVLRVLHTVGDFGLAFFMLAISSGGVNESTGRLGGPE